jgi:hypothetical protein
MLNELSQVVDSFERLGMTTESRHSRINPMGKNKDLLVVCLAKDGSPRLIEVLPGEKAATLFRVEHGSAGSSFPGFNLPTPLRRLDEVAVEKLTPAVENLLVLDKNKNTPNAALAGGLHELFKLSVSRVFTASQEKQFQRSCVELVVELREKLSSGAEALKNFLTLLAILDEVKPVLTGFSNSVAELLANRAVEYDRNTLLLFHSILFGALDWKKRAAKDRDF